MTEIFTTKKLEKIIQKRIEKGEVGEDNYFGNWNANVFYIAKKKCLLFVHAQTFYSVIIPKFSVKDLDKIDHFFVICLYNQLLIEKIEVDFEVLVKAIGNIRFHPTNNNRQITGILNYNIEKMGYFKYDYPVFNVEVILEMTEKLNKTPFKQLEWSNPHEKMKIFISNKLSIDL